MRSRHVLTSSRASRPPLADPMHSALEDILRTRRLLGLARHILPDEPMVDVGTDHALLPIACVVAQRVPWAIASDLREGPLAFARAHRSQHGIDEQSLSIRLGPGLSTVRSGEVKSATIAGMGGVTICEILRDHPPQTLGLQRLVLQPTQAEDELRGFIAQSGHLRLIKEFMIEEAGRFYTNHVIEVHSDARYADLSQSPRELFLGRVYLDAPPEAFVRWCAQTHQQIERLLRGLERAHDQELVRAKRDEASQRLRWLAQVLDAHT